MFKRVSRFLNKEYLLRRSQTQFFHIRALNQARRNPLLKQGFLGCSIATLGGLLLWNRERMEKFDAYSTEPLFLPFLIELEMDDRLFSKPESIAQNRMLRFVSWDGTKALFKAQADVLEVWKSVQREATTPLNIEKPRVTLQQDKLSIRFGIAGDVDVLSLVVQIMDALSNQAFLNKNLHESEVQIRMAESGISGAIQFDCMRSSSVLSVRISLPVNDHSPEIEILKQGALTDEDLTLVKTILQTATTHSSNINDAIDRFVDRWVQSEPENDPFEELELRMRQLMDHFPFGPLLEMDPRSRPMPSQPQIKPLPEREKSSKETDNETLIQKLEAMGAVVYRPNPTQKLDWGSLAGYEDQKRRIEDSLLLPLLYPDVYESIAKKTRKLFASNRPRGILFEGPPGTGKTSSARIIASQASVHLIYIPLESIVSKWYGESEKLLSEAFKLADQLEGTILFFDEIETLGGKRNDEMHEASRRLLSVLLREMDGFDQRKSIIVIGATNRKRDIDPALLSRFDSSIVFGLPNQECRALIFQHYAQQLKCSEIEELAKKATGMSGRDIRDICESTERAWASKIVRGEISKDQLPSLSEYLDAVSQREESKSKYE